MYVCVISTPACSWCPLAKGPKPFCSTLAIGDECLASLGLGLSCAAGFSLLFTFLLLYHYHSLRTTVTFSIALKFVGGVPQSCWRAESPPQSKPIVSKDCFSIWHFHFI